MKITRRKLLKLSLIAGAAGAGLGGYAWQVEPRWTAYTKLDLPVPDLPQELIDKSCIQISDLHIGTRVGESYLRSNFEYIQSLAPDFVFYTGDFVDHADELHFTKLKNIAEHLPTGKLGTAGVLGNHDFQGQYKSVELSRTVSRTLENNGINVLNDDQISLSGLTVGGLEDYWSPIFRIPKSKSVIQSLPSCSIVLSHNPDTADLDIWNGYKSWILCGHTHGGQCRIPFVGPPFLPVENRNYVSGSYQIAGGHQMYINRGLGHTHQIRCFARPEVTVFTLKKA